MNLTFTAIFQEVPKGYVAFVEELPGAEAKGATLEEARKNLAEAAYNVVEENRRAVGQKLKNEPLIKEALSLSAE